MHTLLITGGAGFIGSHFIRHILATEPETFLVNLDKGTYAANWDALPVDDRLVNIRGDIGCEEDLDRVFRLHAYDAVVNFAAETHVDNSIEQPRLFLEVNTLGFQRLYHRAMREGVPLFVQISTDEIYGTNRLGRPFIETDPIGAANPYSISKAGAELVMRAAENTYGYRGMIIRPSNNFGSGQFPEKLIPRSLTRLARGEEILLYGEGLQRRDWLHVDDNVRLIRSLMRYGRPGEAYNLCSGVERTNREVIAHLLDAVNECLGTAVRFEEKVRFVEDRKGHDFSYSLSHDKALRLLGDLKLRPFKDAIREVVRIHLADSGVME